MSFDVNVLSAKPVIKAAASMQNDGGGGNLGYMSQGGHDEEQKQKKQESIFNKKPQLDSFGFETHCKIAPDESFSIGKLIEEIINSIKSLFVKN